MPLSEKGSVGHESTSNLFHSQFNSVYSLITRSGFQLVDISPWPLSVSFSVLGLTSTLITFFCEGVSSLVVFSSFGSLTLLIISLVRWWGDMIMESTFLGCYSSYVIRNMRFGFFLFILSEVFFFVGFFWAFFNASIGELSMKGVGCWPPVGIKTIYPWRVPFLNTAVLLTSAFMVTWAHKAVALHNKSKFYSAKSLHYQKHGLRGLGLAILFGGFFTYLQATEYYMSSFCISDGVYGSSFYMLTGFHGLHVMVGTIFLVVCWFRLYYFHFSEQQHYCGLDAAVCYWHFVDVVWIGVFASVYVWAY